MFRAFVALDLPDPLIAPLVRLQEQLTVGREVPEENLHLTLCFLGDQSPAILEELHYRLEAVAKVPAPALRLSGLITLGGRRPRVVAADVDRSEALARLQRAVRGAADGAGIPLRRARFRPHVTLARFGQGIAAADGPPLGRFLAAHGDFAAGPERAACLTLYRSHLRSDGAVYEPLVRYGFAGEKA